MIPQLDLETIHLTPHELGMILRTLALRATLLEDHGDTNGRDRYWLLKCKIEGQRRGEEGC